MLSTGDTSLTSSYGRRSESASSLSSSLETSTGMEVEDLDLMDSLVQDVRSLSEALNKLSAILEGCETITQTEENQAYCVQVHSALTGVSRTLKELLDKYSFLRCSEVLSPASNLIHCVKGLKFDDVSKKSEDESFERALTATQKLQVAVAERVGDYLTWELTHYESSFTKLSQSNEDIEGSLGTSNYQQTLKVNTRTSSTTSMGSSNGGSTGRLIQRRHSTFQTNVGKDFNTSDEMDSVLENLNEGVEHAFSRAKAWSKYCKEILQFVQRRINLETSHAKELQKLAEQTQSVIQDEEFLPLQSTYVDSFKTEIEFFQNCTDTMKHLYEYKFVKPLESRKNDHDKKRKELQNQWDKHRKSVADTYSELKKARQIFQQRELNYRKARESSVKTEMASIDKGKIDKRRKLEEDAMLKREQASKECKNLENKLQQKKDDLNRGKATILRELRDLIYQCDQTTKACTVAYFQALSGLWALIPMQYQNLSDRARSYIPGMEYMHSVQALRKISAPAGRCGGTLRKTENLLNVRCSNDDLSLLPQFRNKRKIRTPGPEIRLLPEPRSYPDLNLSPMMKKKDLYNNNNNNDPFSDDNPSIHSSSSDVNFQLAPRSKRTLTRTHSADTNRSRTYSDAAQTHSLERIRMPARCCQCSLRSIFNTVQCSDCGMTWHKSCVGQIRVRCDPGAMSSIVRAEDPSKMSIFGVSLQEHLKLTEKTVPSVLVQCTEELEKRGAFVKGLYRVCGVKSKIEQLCEEFERSSVDLSGVHPTNIASVVKLYLRQLPQPLLTENLYPDFIHIAKNFSQEKEAELCDTKDYLHQAMIADLKHVIGKLPPENYESLKHLMLHLKRITWNETENHMSAMNMGIVFGPTLMWREEKGAALNSLLEAPLQTRVVELIVRFACEIFNVNEAEERKRLLEKCGGKSWTDRLNEVPEKMKSSSLRGHPHPHRKDLQRSLTTTIGSNPSSLFIPKQTESEIRRTSEGTEESPNSEADSCETEDIQRIQNSATPDLLKSRPIHEKRPQSSPNSSFGSGCSPTGLHDHSFSSEDITSMVFGENSLIRAKYSDNNNTRIHSDTVEEHLSQSGSRNTGVGVARKLSAESAEVVEEKKRHGWRFERGRPIRRATSKPRSYTTSIFVNTSRNSGADSQSEDYGTCSSGNSEELLTQCGTKGTVKRDVKSGDAGTLRIVLDGAPYGTRDCSESKSKDSISKNENVRLIFSANPDDLSYV